MCNYLDLVVVVSALMVGDRRSLKEIGCKY
jgi:hypothetical protein